MGTIATLAVALTLAAEAYHKGLEAASQEAESKSQSITKSLSNIGQGIVFGAGALVAGGLAEAGNFLSDSVEKANDAQAAQSQLQAVIKSTGGAAGMTAEAVNNLAENFAKTTKYSADQTLSGEDLLLTFTNIGKDVFPDTTTAMLNMSTAMNQDLKSSAIQLGKALNDPTQGMSALQRVGVTFTEQQKKQIEAMQKSGDVAGAQKMILAELNREFGGSAEAAGKTAAGGMAIFDHQIEETQERIGGAMLPAISKLAETLSTELDKPEVQQGINNIATGLGNIAMVVVDNLPTVLADIQSVFEYLKANPALVAAALAMIGVAVLTFVIPALVGAVTAAAPVIAVFAVIGAAAYLLYQAWNTNFLGIRTTTETIFNALKLIFDAFKAAFSGDWSKFGEDLRAAWDLVWNLFTQRVSTLWTDIKGIFGHLIDDVIKAFKNPDWGGVGSSILQGIVHGIESGADWIIDAAKNAAQAALDAAKGFLGIHSPSLAFAEIGTNMMAGMAGGIEHSSRVPMLATTRASAAVLSVAAANSTPRGSPASSNARLEDLLSQLLGKQMNEKDLARSLRDALLQVQS